jgi:mono/diheme cytochrome c family protein
MQRTVHCLFASCAMLVLSNNVNADTHLNPGAIAAAVLSTSQAPAPTAPPIQNTSQSASPAHTPNATPAPNAASNGPIKLDPKMRPENQVPSTAQLESGQTNYLRYCADCHGKNGEGKVGPKLVGSLMVTGPTYGHIAVVLSGHVQSKMPSWGISEISDEVIASVVTYQRNAWGNGNKKEYGQNAGGVVTPSQVHEYRKTLKNLPAKQDVRT